MKIIVCIKSIASALIRNNGCEVAINPYDLYALKQAVRLKDKLNVEVICVNMGIANPLIEVEAKMHGCDKMIFLSDKAFAKADTLATSYTLSQAIKKIGEFDFIFCGACSLDGETGQVAPDLACLLDISYLENASEIFFEDKGIVIQKTLNDYVYSYKAEKPLVISFNNFIMGKSLSLYQLKKARTIVPNVWNAEYLQVELDNVGELGSRTKVIRSKNLDKGKIRSCILDKNIDKLIEFFNGDLRKVFKG